MPRPRGPQVEKPILNVNQMWLYYQVVLQFDGPFAAAIPKDLKEIHAMLEHRMPSRPPENHTPIEELAQQVATEVADPTGEEESRVGWSTFKRDELGLYYEGRCVRGHLKDCALQVAPFFPTVLNFRAKFVNKVYVATDKVHLARAESIGQAIMQPDGTEQRFIQVLTRQGPRSSMKNIDYVVAPRITFILKVLNDTVITEQHLRAVFEYGGTHGMGQERSQEWGHYRLESLEQITPNAS